MDINEMRKATGMSQKAFAEYLGCSKRSIEDWESSRRNCKEWIRALIEYKLKGENLIK